MGKAILTSLIVCALGLLSLPQTCSAGNYTTTITQGAGQNWNGAIWMLDGAGAAVVPSAGNTYECVSNGTAFGSGTANTRIRNPAASGLQTFPGDSLKLTRSNGILLEADEVVGPWQTNSASSPFTVSTSNGKKFYRVQVQ